MSLTSQEIESADELTSALFTDLLQRNWEVPSDFEGVQSIAIEREEKGLLSKVFRVQLEYKGRATEKLPDFWIAKFARDDLNLGWMFQSEDSFYGYFGPHLINDDFPFTVPRMLSGSGKHLILEGIPDAECYELMNGSPPEKVGFLTTALASLHAKSWRSKVFQTTTHSLIHPPGMGQRLDPLQLEYLFATKWTQSVHHLNLDEHLQGFADSTCGIMGSLRLRDIPNKVHSERLSCVHGDFHVANWLFPSSGSKPVLVDWATFGFGNPMTDAAFFVVLNEEVASDVGPWLGKYYGSLTSYNSTLGVTYTFKMMLENFKYALLCQWMILVAYDEMCRGMAMAESDPIKQKRQLSHFENVNRRAIIALRGVGGLEAILQTIPKATDQERLEAEEFCLRNPLAI